MSLLLSRRGGGGLLGLLLREEERRRDPEVVDRRSRSSLSGEEAPREGDLEKLGLRGGRGERAEMDAEAEREGETVVRRPLEVEER